MGPRGRARAAEVADRVIGSLHPTLPEGERHVLAFEGHMTDLTERDRFLLEHIDARTMVAAHRRLREPCDGGASSSREGG